MGRQGTTNTKDENEFKWMHLVHDWSECGMYVFRRGLELLTTGLAEVDTASPAAYVSQRMKRDLHGETTLHVHLNL